MPTSNGLLDFFFLELESKLVSQLCKDEKGDIINNHKAIGDLNGNSGPGNGVKGNNGDAKNNFGFTSPSNDGYGNNGYRENGIGDNDREEIQNQRRFSGQGNRNPHIFPISHDLPPVQVFATNKHKYIVDTAVTECGMFYKILTIFMLTFCCRRWRMVKAKT